MRRSCGYRSGTSRSRDSRLPLWSAVRMADGSIFDTRCRVLARDVVRLDQREVCSRAASIRPGALACHNPPREVVMHSRPLLIALLGIAACTDASRLPTELTAASDVAMNKKGGGVAARPTSSALWVAAARTE